MSFDVHQLDQFLLVGSAVTLLAILAVWVSSRAGLPAHEAMAAVSALELRGLVECALSGEIRRL